MSGPTMVDTATALLREHPRLRDAVQPAPVTPTGPEIDPARNSRLFGMDDRWRRRLVANPEGLVGPIVCEGCCMPSTFPTGVAALWLDTDMQPEPGDLVLIHYSDADVEKLIEDGRQSPEWMAICGDSQIPNTIVKQLVELDGHLYLAAEDGALRYGGARVMGVVRYAADVPREMMAQALAGRAKSRPATMADIHEMLKG